MKGYTVTLRYENPWECVAQKPIAIGVSKAEANTIRRHYERKYKNNWSDYNQSGIYVMSVSRTYCTNHADFEREYGDMSVFY